MSTIASPRPLPSPISTPATSRRTSLDVHSRSAATSPARAAPQPRRNRTALRDYYGLKNSTAPLPESEDVAVKQSELDQDGFDAKKHVQSVLEREGLDGLLKVEGDLLSEIRSLDGERKALVYDNYSKLIAATETIKKMRTNMDPLEPTTSTLSPAISHIVDTTVSLTATLPKSSESSRDASANGAEEDARKRRLQDKVQTILDTPRTLESLIQNGKRAQADRDWALVKPVVDAWEARGIKGATELKRAVSDVLDQESKS